MHHKLHFLGWTRSLADSVSSYLLPDDATGPYSLRDTILVVPTSESGRRLRRALAKRAEQFNSGVLTGKVVTPFQLLDLNNEKKRKLSLFEETAVWIDVLSPARCHQLTALFPKIPRDIDFAWRRKGVRLLVNVRAQLAEAGLTPKMVFESEHIHAAEINRWRDIATLESIVIERLSELGLKDRVTEQLADSANAPPPDGIQRIVLCACPELVPLLQQLLGRWSASVTVEILVHAPDNMSSAFDTWGCPVTTFWQSEALIDLEQEHAQLCVVDSPKDQADAVQRAMIAHKNWAESGQFAVGVPDESVTPFIVAMLEEMGCPCFDPAGVPHRQHPIFQFIKSWRDLSGQKTFTGLRDWVRLANVLHFLEQHKGISGHELLVEMDTAQNDCLPVAVEDLAVYISRNRTNYPQLNTFIPWLTAALHEPDALGPFSMMGRLSQIYQQKKLVPGKPDDDAFISVARELVDACDQVTQMKSRYPGIRDSDWVDLLLESSETRFLYPDTRQNAVELEGWLELPWNDAPLMMITGMNEGFVPASRFDDLFLPDSVREKLGLRCDAIRCARDAYVLYALNESRRTDGFLVLVSGRNSDTGDVLKPSRLFWRCSDDVMVRRTKLFFTPSAIVKTTPERSFSISLDIAPPDEKAQKRLNRAVWNVTDFSAYLKCPYGFYLTRVLEMAPMDDAKEEMDDLDFGGLVHHALEIFGRDPSTSKLRDAGKISKVLESFVHDKLMQTFGRRPPLVVELQAQSAVQRLRAFADLHVRDMEEGWSIVDVEKKYSATFGNMSVRGKIDRIDRHTDGRLRVLDYKTSDNAKKTPESIHLIAPRAADTRAYVEVMCRFKNRKNETLRHWADLQLPFYHHFIMNEYSPDTKVEAGYLQLTKAVSDIKISLWPELDAALVQSAMDCAEGVLRDAQAGIYGPPLVDGVDDTFEERWWPGFMDQVLPPKIEARS